MWAIIRRAIVPATLLAGGLASLIYGAIFHAVPVVEDHESETTIEVPAELPPRLPMGENFPPDGAPFFPPLQMVKKKVTRVETVAALESEPAAMRDASVGAIELLESGELKRAAVSTEGPALCPS
jgi:hypothetical protein